MTWKKSPLPGEQVQIFAARGLFNGQSVTAALVLGANAVWIGMIRGLLCRRKLGASKAQQDAVKKSGFDDNVQTIIFTVYVLSFLSFLSFLPLRLPPLFPLHRTQVLSTIT